MAEEFGDFINRIRAGDGAAAEELVRRYETTIRVAVRARLTDSSLKRRLDSMDICQSVLANFFARAAAGQFDLESPDQLARLLATMARNKLISAARKQSSRSRDRRREVPGGLDNVDAAGMDPTPSRQLAAKELLSALRSRLTEEERKIADLRGLGRSWPEVAAELGGTPEARRKQLARALDRIAPELGLEDPDAWLQD